MSNFSKNLKTLRQRKGLTQEKLADDLIIRRPTLAAYEEGRGEPHYDRLIIMAGYFKISIDKFLTELV